MNYLPCPECGDDVESLPANPPSEFFDEDEPYWLDGDEATCHCGARVMVEADGTRAWLKTVEEDE